MQPFDHSTIQPLNHSVRKCCEIIFYFSRFCFVVCLFVCLFVCVCVWNALLQKHVLWALRWELSATGNVRNVAVAQELFVDTRDMQLGDLKHWTFPSIELAPRGLD